MDGYEGTAILHIRSLLIFRKGVSLLAYFAPVILQGIGLADGLISILSGVISIAFFLGTIPTYWTIEKYGRRFIM